MQQTGISRAEAIKALVENDNDVVEAIMVIEEAAEEAAAE
jgi:NACalpha-BTF3-like transcription factor